MKKFFDEDLYLEELRDRIRKMKKKSCSGRYAHIIICILGVAAIGVLIAILVKKLSERCCNDDDCCCCDDDLEEDDEDDAFAHDDDFEDA